MVNIIKKVIVITAGDPASIAPYITLEALLQSENSNDFCVIANYNFMQKIVEYYKLEINLVKIKKLEEISKLNNNFLQNELLQNDNLQKNSFQSKKVKMVYILDIEFNNFNNSTNLENFLGIRDYNNSQYVLQSIDKAVSMALNKEVDAIVTNPIDKDLVNQYIKSTVISKAPVENFSGHTGYLAQSSSVATVVMMMATPFNKLKVIPFTTHIALNKVAKEITKEKLEEVITITVDFLENKFKIINPTIGVCGLNPHSGENGLMGIEEIEEINPVIKKLQQQGLNIVGSIPADTIFVPSISKDFDVIIGMYHDQVLAPFKAFYFDEGVNTTLGLPFIRTSPDHGCAFSKAKTKDASCRSLLAAMIMAQKLT